MTNNKPLFDKTQAKELIEKGRRAKWWRRKGSKSRGFHYVDPGGKIIKNKDAQERIASLVIPPAWKHVRVSPFAASSIQAVGMDLKGRVQYLYNQKFREKQERKKFEKIERFGEFLPKLRRVTNEDIALEGFPREKVLAMMMRLINSLYIRLGSPESVRHYRTYGITTLQNRHLEVKRGGRLVFTFVGKHSIEHRKVLVDKELAAAMQELKEIGGARKLFNYTDENGKPRPVKSKDVNEYLKAATSEEFSAKDFRTWGGTLLAALELADIGAEKDEKTLKKNIVRAVRRVAEQLGNTPSVCRASYIHPVVLKTYEKGITLDEFRPKKGRIIPRVEAEYEPEEKALIKLFKSEKV
jgi:DNA topoisomerase-1